MDRTCDTVGRRGNLLDLSFANYFKTVDLLFNKYTSSPGFLLGTRDGVRVMWTGFDSGLVANARFHTVEAGH